MSKLRPVGVHGQEGVFGYTFWCPGCDRPHYIPTKSRADLANHGPRATWKFDGNTQKPTFEPSILVHEVPSPHGSGTSIQPRCHSFVRNGQIQFLADCGHKLAGQTVELPDYPSSGLHGSGNGNG